MAEKLYGAFVEIGKEINKKCDVQRWVHNKSSTLYTNIKTRHAVFCNDIGVVEPLFYFRVMAGVGTLVTLGISESYILVIFWLLNFYALSLCKNGNDKVFVAIRGRDSIICAQCVKASPQFQTR